MVFIAIILIWASIYLITPQQTSTEAAGGTVSGYEGLLYTGQLHNHAGEYGDDGTGTVSAMMDYMRYTASPTFDFGGLSPHSHMITPSNYLTYAGIVQGKTVEGTFVGIPGQEWSTLSSTNHVNIYYADEHCSVTNGDIPGYYDWLVDSNGYGSFNHPWDSGGSDMNNWEYYPSADKPGNYAGKMIMMEMKQATGSTTGFADYMEALNKGWHIGITVSDDNHDGDPGDKYDNNPRTGMWLSSLSTTSVKSALANLRFFGSQAENGYIDLKLGSHAMGDIATGLSSSEYLYAKLNPSLSYSEVVLYYQTSSGYSTSSLSSYTTGEYRISIDASIDSWYFVRAKTSSGAYIVSSPIWTDDDGGTPPPPPPPSNVLENGVGTTGSLADNNAYYTYQMDVASGATSMHVVLTCGSADFDFFASHLTSDPSYSSNEFKGYTSGGEDATFSNPSSGTWYFKVDAYSGAPSSYEITVTVTYSTPPPTDTTAPTVSISSPSNGATVSGTVSISMSASDANGISSRAIKIDGTTKSTSSTYSWDTTGYSNGQHTIRAEATDPSGNTGYQQITVTVDNAVTPPPTNTLQNGVTATGSLADNNAYYTWQMSVDSNALSMHVLLTCGSADFDFFASHLTNNPTHTNKEFEGYTSGGEEATFSNPGSGTWYIKVDAYSGAPSSYDLTVTVTYDTPVSADAVVINEFLPAPSSTYTEEWIELYNPTSSTLDLSGYKLDDITSGGTSAFTIPSGTTIPANGFIVFYASTTNIALNNGGDTCNFLSPSNQVLDSKIYTSIAYDTSIARETDGGSTWVTDDTPTPNESNSASSSAPSTPTEGPPYTFTGTCGTDQWFDLYLEAGQTVLISLSWSGSTDLDWFLYRESDTSSYLARGYTTNNPESGTWQVDQSGWYKIRINKYSGVDVAFTLSVTYT